MRILIRSHHSLNRAGISGGAQRLMQNIATALSESGWTVDILSPAAGEDEAFPTESLTFHEFQYGNPNTPVETVMNTVRGIRKYRSIINQSNYDVLLDDISHYPYYPAHFYRPNHIENVLFLHVALFEYAKEYNGRVKGTVVNMIDRTLPYLDTPEIVCAGPSTEHRVQSKLDYERTRVLNPCIDVEQFEYNFSPDSTTILYLGRLGPRKNVSCLLRAWKLLEDSGLDDKFTLVIAGSGSKEQQLRTLRDELRLKNVEFRGYVSDGEKIRLLSDSLFYVLPSKMEGYVTSGLEALASGTPVVGSDTFGINDYIVNEETGYLFHPNDHRHLANLLNELISEPTQTRSVVERGYELALDHSYSQFRSRADTLFRKIAQPSY